MWGLVASVGASLLSKATEKKDKAPAAPAAPAVAQNSAPSVGNALNGSGGKVMMAVPVKDVETVSKIITTA